MPGSRDDCHLCHIHDHSHPSSLLRTSTLRDNSPPPHRPRRHSHSRSRSGSIDNQYRNPHPDHHHHHNHHHHDRDRHHHHSRVGRVPSALARLSEHSSHSLPASRSNTLNLYPEQVSVLPDGGHRYIGGDRASVRSLELTSPRHAADNRSHHSLHQTTSLQKPSGAIHASPDILTASLPPLRSHGGSHLSLNHAPPGLTAVQDRTQDYYMQVNRLPSFKDDSRKHRFNLQTAMLIGCYTLLFVMAIIIGVVLCHQNGWLGFGSPENLSATEDPLDPNGVFGSVRGDAIDGIGGQHGTDIDPDTRLKRLKDGTSSQIPVHNVVQVRTPENGQLNVAGVFTGSPEGGRPRSISGAGRVANIPGNRPVQTVPNTSQQGDANANQPPMVSNQGHTNPSLDPSNTRNTHQANSNNPAMNHGNSQMHNMNQGIGNSNQNLNQGTNSNPNFNQASNTNQNLHQANSNQNFNRVNPNGQTFNQAPNNNNHNTNSANNNNPNVNHHFNQGTGMNSRELNKAPTNHQNRNNPPVGNNNNNMNHPVNPQGSNNFHGMLHLNTNNPAHSGNQHQQHHPPPPPNIGMPPRDVPVPSLVPGFIESTRGELQQGSGKESSFIGNPPPASFIGNPPPASAQNNPFVVFSSPVHSNSPQHIPGPFQNIPHQNEQPSVVLQGGIVQQIPTGNSKFITVVQDRPHIGSHSTQVINQTQPQIVSFVPDSQVFIGQSKPQKDQPLQFAVISNPQSPFANAGAPLFPPPLPASQDQNGQQASIITVSQGNSIINGPPPTIINNEPKPIFIPPQPVFPPPFISANKKQPNRNKPQFNLESNKQSDNVQISQEQPTFKPQFNIANDPNNHKASDKNTNAQINEINMEKMKMLKEILEAEGSGKLLQDLIALKNNRVSLTTISQDLSDATTKHGPSPSIHTPAPQRNLPNSPSPAVQRQRNTPNSSSAIFINTHNKGSSKAKNTSPISPTTTAGNTQLRQQSKPNPQSSETGSTKSKSNIQVVRELLASLISSPEVQEILNTRNRQLAKQAQTSGRGGRTTNPTNRIPLKGDEMRALLLKALAKELPNGQSVQSLRLHGPQPSVTRQTVPPAQSTLRRGEKAGQVRGKVTRAEQLSHLNTTLPVRGRPRSLPPTLHFSNRMGVADNKNGLTSIEHQSVRPPTVSRTSRGRERRPTPDFRLKVKSDGEATGSGQRDQGEEKKMVTESVDMRTGKDALEGDVVRKWMHMDDDGTVSQGTVRRDGSFAFTNCRPAKMCQEQQPNT